MMDTQDKKEPLFMISVVARMLNVHPQTLRLYEREGLITPYRRKNSRLYSQEDVERLEFILSLTRDLGVNRSGVEIILRLRNRLESFHKEMEDMMNMLDDDVRRDFFERFKKICEEK